MSLNIVHVIALDKAGHPDLEVIRIWGSADIFRGILSLNGLKWWRAMIDATTPEMKAWRDGASNRIGWLASGAPDAIDITRLADGLFTALGLVSQHPFWLVAPRLGDGPDVTDPLHPITITASRAVFDWGAAHKNWILWDVDSSNTGAELIAWRDADSSRHAWANASPPTGAFETNFINAIIAEANSTQRFAGAEAAS